MATKKNGIDSTIETITPAMAKKILNENNIDNRRLRPTVITKYAEDMKQGNWIVGTSTIVFNGNGDLLDGQHRLAASVEANVGFQTAVLRGVDAIAREAIDTGVRRSFGDVLTWKGETSVTHLAAAIRMGYRWQAGDIFGNVGQWGTFTHAKGLDWYGHNPSIRKTISLGQRLKLHHKIPNPTASAFMHRISMIDEEQADEFIARLDIGEGLVKGDPILALRSWLMNQMARNPNQRPNADFYLAVLIKSWNYWVMGDDDVKLIAFKRGGTFKERLPELLDFDGNPVVLKNELDVPVEIPVPEEYR